MNFINTLSPWQWALLAAVPAAIIALYFLKLKRQPLEVPSTYLWSRTIEDLHVNSIWQRLRQSLLLLLQLLFVALVVLACFRPGWRGARLTGDRFIFLIDTSASMSATDVEPSRLEAAKEQVLALIAQMKSDDVAMIISFSDRSQIEQSFTDNRALLKQAVARIGPTNRTSDLREALRAASGLANPGRTSDAENAADVQVADPLPATLYLFTDGGFSAVPDFSLGNLEPEYFPMGTDSPANVAVVSFSAERNPEKPDQLQAFARLENSGPEDVRVSVSLYRDDEFVDAKERDVPAGDSAGVDFDLLGIERGTLRLELDQVDHLSLDNVAHTAINPSRPARVLAATPGNEALRLALDTDEIRSLANVVIVKPAELETKQQQDLADAGYYDLILYDRCVPQRMPQANTLFIGRTPPVEGWSQGEVQVEPFIIDTDRVHPLTQYLELGNVTIVEGRPLKTPPGGATLIDSHIGPLLSIAPREGFEDAVLGFEILGQDEEGNPEPKTDWHIRRSFPVFVMNAVRYLGGVTVSAGSSSAKPGTPYVLRTETPVERITVQLPDKRRVEVPRDTQNTYVVTNTDQLGVYAVFEGSNRTPTQQFAVNLFDSRESDLRVRPEIKLGYEKVASRGGLEPTRKEMWKWLLLVGLLLLVFEWYVYNRRVYL
jgi:hypothetical protein